MIGMVVEVPLPNGRAGQTIAPRVSSSQPPLVLAWRCASALDGVSTAAGVNAIVRQALGRDDRRDSDVANSIVGPAAPE